MSQKNIPYLIVHGHFYQPPRENPWLEAIEQQDSASPFHDWNERITYECYNPNSVSKIVNYDKSCNVQLVPVGAGRENLIDIIEKNDIASKNIINKNKIVKLCLDYTTQKKQNDNTSKKVCKIMKYYIEKSMKNNSFNILDEISNCLIVTFKLSNYCKEWLETFFDKIINYYNNTDTDKKRIAEIIMEFVIKNSSSKVLPPAF